MAINSLFGTYGLDSLASQHYLDSQRNYEDFMNKTHIANQKAAALQAMDAYQKNLADPSRPEINPVLLLTGDDE